MRVLLTGASGILGTGLRAAAGERGWEVTALSREDLDVTDRVAVREAVDAASPDAVFHCAAFTAVDAAESRPDDAFRVNRDGTRHVAEAAHRAGALLVYPGTDYVFDGGAGRPYRPGDPTNPLSVYGASKLAGEEEARAAARHLVVRTSWLYGAGGRNFVDTMVRLGREGRPLRVVDDQTGSPTWAGSLAPALLDLAEAGTTGLLHVADRGEATWRELAVEALRLSGVAASVEPVSTREWGAAAPRPRRSVLDPAAAEDLLGRRMPDWRTSLAVHLGVAGQGSGAAA